MNASRPPALATTLLNRLSPRNDALAGDMTEEFRLRRSRTWYWRQVIGAITAGIVHDVRAHPAVALRAVVVGWAVYACFTTYLFEPVFRFDQWLFARGLVHWVYMHGVGFPRWFFPTPAKAIMFMASGWVVGRTHRQYGFSMVVAYAAFALCTNMVMLAQELANPNHYYSAAHMLLSFFVVYPITTLSGGIWGAGPRGSTGPTGVVA